MIVATVIGILMAAGIVAFTEAQKSSRDAKRRADVDAVVKALETRYADLGFYVVSPTLPLTPSAAGYRGYLANNNLWGFLSAPSRMGSDYFQPGQEPYDPINNGTYGYRMIMAYPATPPTGFTEHRFCIGARLEKTKRKLHWDRQ